MHSFTAHGADVLCLTIGTVRRPLLQLFVSLLVYTITQDGTSVFTSGVDQKVCLFSHVEFSKSGTSSASSKLAGGSTARWIQATSKRMHSHDVRALAVWPPYTPAVLPLSSQRHSGKQTHSRTTPAFYAGLAPILASGGLDATLVLAPCASARDAAAASLNRDSRTGCLLTNPLAKGGACTFEDSYYRQVAYAPPVCCVAKKARLLACVREGGVVGVWRVRGRPARPLPMEGGEEESGIDVGESEGEGFEKVLEMELDTTTNICAAALSDDGRWLAVADMYETKLFELQEVVRLAAHRMRLTIGP